MKSPDEVSNSRGNRLKIYFWLYVIITHTPWALYICRYAYCYKHLFLDYWKSQSIACSI